MLGIRAIVKGINVMQSHGAEKLKQVPEDGKILINIYSHLVLFQLKNVTKCIISEEIKF